jgi:hypothetical protein
VGNHSQEATFVVHVQMFGFNQHLFFHSTTHKKNGLFKEDPGLGKPVTQAEYNCYMEKYMWRTLLGSSGAFFLIFSDTVVVCSPSSYAVDY